MPQEDFRFKEALMHAFGLLAEHMAHTAEYQQHAENLLQAYIYPELESENAFLRARACWVYGQFGHFPFSSDEHLRYALNGIFSNLSHPDLPVRVNAAVSLI